MALPKRLTGELVLKMSCAHDGVKHHHCAFCDADLKWECRWISGRGVLKDNQADVLTYLAKASDASSKEAAHTYFQEPYTCKMRIKAVYELNLHLQRPKAIARSSLCHTRTRSCSARFRWSSSRRRAS